MPGIQVSNCSKSTINQKNNNDIIICWHNVIHKLFWRSVSLQVQLLVQVSCQYHYWFWKYDNFCLKGIWPEIRKSEISPSQFCLISRDLGELVIPTLLWMSLIKSYVMLQNPRLYSFYCFWVIKAKPTGAWGENTPHYPD